MEKILMVVVDGMGDLPVPELGDKTPLEAARLPNLNALAQRGVCGLVDVVNGKACESDIGHLTMFGYRDAYCGRGTLEALGLNFALQEGDVAFRANFATVEGGKITDRRAGRIASVHELADAVNGKRIDDCVVHIVPGIGHRAAMVIRGPKLGSMVSDTDAKQETRPLPCIPLSPDPGSIKTAGIVNRFSEMARLILKRHPLNERLDKKANVILLRGAGQYTRPQPFHERYGLRAVEITEGGLYRGIGKYLGMDSIVVKGVTETFESDLSAQFDAAREALTMYDFVFVHVKATDDFGHDGKAEEKMRFLEKLDAQFGHVPDALLVVTADHATPCILKAHSGDPVPILFYRNGIDPNGVLAFNERACSHGISLQGREVMRAALRYAGRTSVGGA